MSEYEVRRMDLKSQMLSTEIAQLEKQSKEVAVSLRQRQQKTNEASASWSEYLKKSISAYRGADPFVKTQLLRSKLGVLANANQVIKSQKKEQQKLNSKLNALFIAQKQKSAHLSHCRTIKSKKKESKAQILAQNKQDELVIIKTASQKYGPYNNESASKVLSEKENTLCSIPETTNDKNVNLGEEVSPLANPQFTNIISNSNSQTNEPILVTNVNIDPSIQLTFDQSKNETSHNPNTMQQKWDDATELQEQRLKLNQKVSVSISQTSEGEAVCIDYLAAPGRILSVAGNQTSNSIELCLKATKNTDKVDFKREQPALLDDLRSRGLRIRSLEVLP